MKILTVLFVVFINLSFINSSKASDFEVPKYAFTKAEDYKKFEKDIVNAISWLNNTPLNLHTDKRKEVNLFVMQWLAGVPYITIVVNSDVLPFIGNQKNPDLLMTFMGGWTLFTLNNPDKKDDIVKGTTAGLINVIKYYKGNNATVKDEEIEKLAELYDNNQLEIWVKSKLN